MAQAFYYGGQAVIEGVMMRGQKAVVTAVRRPDGEITTLAEPLNPLYTGLLRKIPFVRGVVVLIEAMVLGVKTLLLSANMSLEQEDVKISGGAVWGLLILSLALATTLFFIVPLFLTRFLDNYTQLSVFFFHLVEGSIRITIFALYLKLVTFMPDIRRIFAYHGAEHKTINAYEAGASLNVESIKSYGTAHVRCGTSFLFVVMAIAIVAFSLVGRRAFYLMVLSRTVLIPAIAAVSYEITYFAGRHSHNPVVRTVLYPGLFFQKLTAKEPDDSQLEVAVSALKRAVEIDSGGEIKPSETLSPGTSP